MPTGSEFSRVNLGGPNDPSSYKQSERQSVGGEYAWVHGQTLPEAGDTQVPSPSQNPHIFSSDVNGDPKALLKAVQPSIDAHSSILTADGYTLPVATLGSHPWLRDSYSTPGTDEPGNAEPNGARGVPMRRDVPNR